MSEADESRVAELLAENERLRSELAARTAVAARALASFQQRALQMEVIRQQNEELDRLAANLAQAKLAEEQRGIERIELIRRLEDAVRALSTPILQVWSGVLALPVIGVLDGARASEMMIRLLDALAHTSSRYAIIDVTGVDRMDASTAEHLIRILRALELMGAKGLITGIRPAVAQTVTSLGVDLSGIVTLGNLQEGLRTCLRWGQRHVAGAAAHSSS